MNESEAYAVPETRPNPSLEPATTGVLIIQNPIRWLHNGPADWQDNVRID